MLNLKQLFHKGVFDSLEEQAVGDGALQQQVQVSIPSTTNSLSPSYFNTYWKSEDGAGSQAYRDYAGAAVEGALQALLAAKVEAVR